MADGQVTRGNEVVKPNVKKVRRLNDAVIGGFAGDEPLAHYFACKLCVTLLCELFQKASYSMVDSANP